MESKIIELKNYKYEQAISMVERDLSSFYSQLGFHELLLEVSELHIGLLKHSLNNSTALKSKLILAELQSRLGVNSNQQYDSMENIRINLDQKFDDLAAQKAKLSLA